MDLTNFTKKKNKEVSKKILDSKKITIETTSKDATIILKSKEALDEYHKIMFFAPTESIISNDKEELGSFFEKSIQDGVEGLMMKNLDSPYSPGIRTGALAKLKEVKEDIDLVILGAEHGKGKRAGFYSSFLVGAYDPNALTDEETFLTVGKVSSGIKELGDEGASMSYLTKLLEPIKTHEEKGVVYFEPKIIIEVRYQEIQQSTTYSSGIALRFPRIVHLREDKNLDEIATVQELRQYSQE